MIVNKKMYRVFYNKTRTIYPRINFTVTNFKNIKTTYSYPVLSGEWKTKYNSELFYSNIVSQNKFIKNSHSTIQLENIQDIFICSYDFEKMFKFQMGMTKSNPTIFVNIDENSDAVTSMKIF